MAAPFPLPRTLLIPLLLAALHTAHAAEWHVSGTGNDASDGRTPATAFRSLQRAETAVAAGDVVNVWNGDYTSDDHGEGSSVLLVQKSGKPEAWITWRAAPGQTPVLRPRGWNGIMITGSYHIFDGITVTGENDAIVLKDAQNDSKKEKADPYFNTNGIYVNGRPRQPNEKPHHVVIRNCTVSKVPGGGIIAIETDYVTVENNKVFQNAWFMRYGGSGISFLNNWAFDDQPGYHNIVRGNYVWDNKTLVNWEKIGHLSDGNGIIMDVTDLERDGALNPDADPAIAAAAAKADAAKPKSARPAWKGRTLIANNVSVFNGGSGIHTFRTSNVDIVHNTTYWNGRIVGYPEVFANASRNIVMTNNVIVPRPGGKVTDNSAKNHDIRWDYNLIAVAQPYFKAEHDIVADPRFVRALTDLPRADFHLQENSPGKDRGAFGQ